MIALIITTIVALIVAIVFSLVVTFNEVANWINESNIILPYDTEESKSDK